MITEIGRNNNELCPKCVLHESCKDMLLKYKLTIGHRICSS